MANLHNLFLNLQTWTKVCLSPWSTWFHHVSKHHRFIPYLPVSLDFGCSTPHDSQHYRCVVQYADSNSALKKGSLRLSVTAYYNCFHLFLCRVGSEYWWTDIAANWAALGICYNTGQDCTAGSRVYVQNSIYDKFVDILVSKVKELSIGDGFDDKNFGGPVVRVCYLIFEVRLNLAGMFSRSLRFNTTASGVCCSLMGLRLSLSYHRVIS